MPKANSRRLDKAEKNVLVHLLQAPKLTNGDIAKIIDVDERTISRRRKQLRTLGHLSPERNVKGAEKLRPWHLERIIALLEENNDLQLKDVQEFLKKEFDLHVTVSTISRQLSRANHARARRPGYKNTRPDLQAEAEAQAQQGQQQMQDVQAAATSAQEPAECQGLAGGDSLHAVHQQQQEEQEQEQVQQQASVSPSVPQQHGQAPAEQIPTVRLACPFYRHDPERYQHGPYCQSSWHSVRDVKEHVFRQHMQPRFRCNRCMANFDDNDALVFHQRDPVPCPLQEWLVPDGCNEDQKEKIRKGDKGDEKVRWKRMFRIIFPHVALDAVPDGVVYDNAYFAAPIDPSLAGWQGPAAAPEAETGVA